MSLGQRLRSLRSSAGEAASARSLLLGFALLCTLGLLLAHAVAYWFLTDDGYISFRYARNLAHGYGLVFNPGHERVEGYTNLLWVLILAAGQLLGLAPERLANPLGLLATAALWALVVWFARRSWRRAGAPPALEWTTVVPPLLLAVTRSVAVWSTSGLETRLFELLVVAGVLRAVVEMDAREAGAAPRPWSGVAFGLACLTRPDGTLIGGCTLLTTAALLAHRRRIGMRYLLGQWAGFVVPGLALFVFRLAYYGDWAPNTYYAKVGGETWFDMGVSYFAMMAVEYGLLTWLPALALALDGYTRDRRLHVPMLFAAAVIPHALYVMSIGGDHFEYRPADLYFPFAYLVLGDGLRAVAGRARGRVWIAPAYLGVVLLAVIWIPARSHLEFPNRYLPGFPGGSTRDDWLASTRFLDPGRDPLLRWPVLRQLATFHRDLLREATDHFVGIRQEEHKLFLSTVDPKGRQLGALVQSGVVPRDLHLALGCVGAIPYHSDLRVLDLLGLTDRVVAHGPFRPGKRIMAHGKFAEPEYLQRAAVDVSVPHVEYARAPLVDPIWALLVGGADTDIRKGLWAAKLDDGGGDYMVVELPMGSDRARARIPALRLRPLEDAAVARAIALEAIAAHEAAAASERAAAASDPRGRLALAALLAGLERHAEALSVLEELGAQRPDDALIWLEIARARVRVGRPALAAEAARQALAVAETADDRELALELRLLSR